MRTVAFDGRMGGSGDMLLGCLIDAGANPGVLDPIATDLSVTFDVTPRVVQGIEATDVTVRSEGVSQPHDAEGHGPHRHYPEVISIVEAMPLPESIKATALSVFELIGQAEASVHGEPLESIHFHAVGADDAIADVVGTVALLDDLDPDRVVTAPVSVGAGEVHTSHGTYPVPPPAVAEIIARTDLVIEGGPIEAELLTPTGAALLGTLAQPVEQLPVLDITAVGYGAGTHSFAERPNVLRALVGTEIGGLRQQSISLLETNVDDATPEVLGHLQTSLLEAGAKDVSIVPMTMKKSRPGHLVRVVVDPADEHRIARELAAETGSLGIRAGVSTHRWIADRAIETVTVDIDDTTYECRVKVAFDEDGSPIDYSAEFDDAASIASETNHPVREIIRRAESAIDGS